jgi:hypothetical protein
MNEVGSYNVISYVQCGLLTIVVCVTDNAFFTVNSARDIGVGVHHV